MAINSIIGQAARGSNFFFRHEITANILRVLQSGGNALLVAPRRVGKSSILLNILDNPPDDLVVVYYISESVNDENEFYKKLLHHLWEKISGLGRYRSIWETRAKEFSSYIESIGSGGIKFRQNSSINYYEELGKLLKAVPNEKKIVVFIDEFASTVENIMNDVDENSARQFLASKRTFRQNPDIQGKICFVYAGSIGLENIVGKMNAIHLINDLVPINVPPLSKSEAKMLTDKILDGSEISFGNGVFDYLCSVIEWLIPFYFQITLDEAYKILTARKRNEITKEIIDGSTKNLLNQRVYFEHWFTRLRTAYRGNAFSFIKELLNQISEKRAMPLAEIIDLAIRYDLERSFHDLVNALKHDGYINNNDDPKTYRFNSYLLREWWNANYAK